jgi:hypothetical protein
MDKWLEVGRVITKIVTVIPMVVNLVEKLAVGIKGKDKQDAALSGVEEFIATLELAFGRELMNQEEFKDIIREMIDVYVKAMNFAKKFKEDNIS